MAMKLRTIFSLTTWLPLQYMLKLTSVLKFLLFGVGQVGTSADSVGRAVPWLTGKQIPGTAVRTLAVVWSFRLLTLAFITLDLVEGYLPPCWGWIFSQLGTAGHVPVAPVLYVGLLSADYKIRWLLLVQSLLWWSFVRDTVWWRDAVHGGLCCSLRADTPRCAKSC